jgi:hypothetical protein
MGDKSSAARYAADQGIIPHSNNLLVIGVAALSMNAARICGSSRSICTSSCSLSDFGRPFFLQQLRTGRLLVLLNKVVGDHVHNCVLSDCHTCEQQRRHYRESQ